MTATVNSDIIILTDVVNVLPGGGINIFSKFLALEPEKKERIINAGIKEFAQRGFNNASTNEIVKEANISKGILFHYFKSKKDLFLFLYDYTVETFMNEFLYKVDLNEQDVFKRYRQMIMLKFEIIKRHPEMYNFLLSSNFEESGELKETLERKNKEIISSQYTRIFENIDTGKFRDDIDVSRALEIIMWTMEGYSNKVQRKAKFLPANSLNFDEMLKEVDNYFELLKKCIYKEP